MKKASNFEYDGFDDIVINAKHSDYLVENGGSIHIFYGPLSGSYNKDQAHEIISSTNVMPVGMLLECLPSADTSPDKLLFSDSFYDGSAVQSRTYFMPWIR